MRRAIEALAPAAEHLLIDARRLRERAAAAAARSSRATPRACRSRRRRSSPRPRATRGCARSTSVYPGLRLRAAQGVPGARALSRASPPGRLPDSPAIVRAGARGAGAAAAAALAGADRASTPEVVAAIRNRPGVEAARKPSIVARCRTVTDVSTPPHSGDRCRATSPESSASRRFPRRRRSRSRDTMTAGSEMAKQSRRVAPRVPYDEAIAIARFDGRGRTLCARDRSLRRPASTSSAPSRARWERSSGARCCCPADRARPRAGRARDGARARGRPGDRVLERRGGHRGGDQQPDRIAREPGDARQAARRRRRSDAALRGPRRRGHGPADRHAAVPAHRRRRRRRARRARASSPSAA